MKRIVFFFLLIFLCAKMQAQDTSINNYFRDNMYLFNGLDKYPVEGFFSTYRIALGLSEDDSMGVVSYMLDASETSFNYRFLQYHKGFLVDGSSFTLHGSRGLVLYAGGNQIKDLDIDVSDPINEDSALNIITNYYSADTFFGS